MLALSLLADHTPLKCCCAVCCVLHTQVGPHVLQQLAMGRWASAAQPQLQTAAGQVRSQATAAAAAAAAARSTAAAMTRTVPSVAAMATAVMLAALAQVLPAAGAGSSLMTRLQQAQQRGVRKVGSVLGNPGCMQAWLGLLPGVPCCSYDQSTHRLWQAALRVCGKHRVMLPDILQHSACAT
jgi:hypothetical protein